jgi:heterodisulfide reductase subunit B2
MSVNGSQKSYLYYPGCSLESTSKEYDMSVRAVAGVIGIQLLEFEGWNCCGASSGHAMNSRLALGLAARNLGLAEKQKQDIAVACPACYLRLRTARHEAKHSPEMQAEIEKITGLEYTAAFVTRHLLDIVTNDFSLDTVREKVIHPLKGLKLAAYYGCYLTRPLELVAFDDPENPQCMDRLLGAAGAELKEWSGKVDCCGGSLSLSKKEMVSKMVNELVESARLAGAEAIATACPLCQANLEMRQKGPEKLPVFYYTELLGMAFGIKESRSWLKGHLISPFNLLTSRGYNLTEAGYYAITEYNRYE